LETHTCTILHFHSEIFLFFSVRKLPLCTLAIADTCCGKVGETGRGLFKNIEKVGGGKRYRVKKSLRKPTKKMEYIWGKMRMKPKEALLDC